jgi:copper chaperone CopZ
MPTRTIDVTGMSCDHCVRAVTEELTALAGVSAVEVDLGSGRVTVTASPMPAEEDLVAVVREAGYEVAP